MKCIPKPYIHIVEHGSYIPGFIFQGFPMF